MPIDKELLELCKRKDRRAQKVLYESCFPFLIKVGYRYTQNKEDAHVLLNNAFLKILTQLDKYNPDQNFEYWSKKIMINTAIDAFRKNKRHQEIFSSMNDFDEQKEHYFIDSNRADKKFDIEEILNLIQTLPAATRNVFNLFAIDGYSHKEIAELLSISEGTSKWHLSEARKALIKKIEAGIITLLFMI